MRAGPTLVVRTPHQAERLGERGASVRPLVRWVQELALADADPGQRAATRAEVWIATRRALQLEGALDLQGTAERRAATIGAFDAAIGWLRRTGARGEVLEGSEDAQHVRVGRVADRAAALLERAGRIDPRALAVRAAERSATSSEGGDVHVVGIAPGDLDTLLAIEALQRSTRDGGGILRVTLPAPRRGPSDGRAQGPAAELGEALAAYLEQRWGAMQDAPEIEWRAARDEPAPRERIEAPTPDAEAREIAAAIARALAGGAAPEAMAVVVPRADDPVVVPLLLALEDAGIPVSREGGDPALETPEAAIALDLLSMSGGRLVRDGIADLLRTPGLHAGAWVGAAGEEEAGRAAVRVAHRLREVPVAVDRSGGASLVESLAAADPLAAATVERIVESVRRLGEARGRAALVTAWAGLVERLRLGRPSAVELGAALRSELAAAAAHTGFGAARLAAMASGALGVAAALGVARSLVDAERALGGEEEAIEAGELLAEVREIARAASASAAGGAPRAGAVRIATPRDLAGLSHRWIAVAGLGANAYGASEVRGLLDEHALAALPQRNRPPPLAVRRAARALELAWVVDQADQVLLTRRAGLPGGHDEAPHPLFGAGPGARRVPASVVTAGAMRSSRRGVDLARLAAGGRTSDERSMAVPSAAREAAAERERFFLDPRVASGRHSGRLVREAAERPGHFGGDAASRTASVTSIERAARCGFAAFSGRVLRARRVEDALEDGNARERGILVHEALRAAFEALREASPSLDQDGQRALAERAARGAVWGPTEPTPLRREVILSALRDAMAVVEADLSSGDAATFRVAEKRFGGAQQDPPPWAPLELRAEPGEESPSIWVDGQIDRLDAAVDGRWVRVVDYKTGKLPKKKDEHVRSLQLALYAEVAALHLSAAGQAGAEPELLARYVVISRGGGVKTRDVPLDEDALLEARRAARRVVLRLWSGEVGARVVDPRACRRCDARDVCRRPAIAVQDDGFDGGSDDTGEGASP